MQMELLASDRKINEWKSAQYAGAIINWGFSLTAAKYKQQ